MIECFTVVNTKMLNFLCFPIVENITYFHIYNQAHQKCVSRTGKRLSVARCDLNQCEQKWSWTRGGQQIISALGQEKPECISVSKLVKFQKIIMYPCESNTSFQRWECKDGDLLSIQGKELYFNYGQHLVDIVLHTGSGTWSRWVKYLTGRSPCDKGWSCIFYSRMLHSSICKYLPSNALAKRTGLYPYALFVCMPFLVAVWITHAVSWFGHSLNLFQSITKHWN